MALSDLLNCAPPPPALCPSALQLALVLSAPHFLYAFIWLRPGAWRRVFGGRSVDAFATCGAIGKALQFAAVALWVACARANGACLDPRSVGLAQWLIGLALVAYGQSLNAGTFAAIGRAGVYYGCKLGVTVQWVTGWPFDAVSHPQYVGSVLSVWGLAALLAGQVPGEALVALAAFWTALYVVTGVHEQHL